MIFILATIVFIAYAGSVGSAEQILKENSINEEFQVTFGGHGAVEDGPAKTLLTVDGELSSEASSSVSGFSSKTQVSVISARAQNSKAAVSNTLPEARIVSITPNPAQQGSSVTFKGRGTDTDGSIKGYLWKIDGTIVSTKASFSTSKIPLGTHTITFSVKDNRGAWSAEVTQSLEIKSPNVAPVANIDFIESTAIFGNNIRFLGSGTDPDGGTIVAYRWKIDGTIVSTEASFDKDDIAVGTHEIAFSVQDDSKAWSAEVIRQLTITEPPKLVASIDSISPGTTVTVGTEITFTGSGTDTYPGRSITGYVWKIDGAIVNEDASFSKSDIAVGTHTITFSVQDDGGASSEATETLTVTEIPVEVPSEATVILTFDDGWKTDYDVVRPLLKERGIRSTHYIIGSMANSGYSDYMSWAEIKTMYDDGFDMECHSYTHKDLTTLSSTAIIKEMQQVDNAFVTHNMKAPRHIAYPYGEYNAKVISAISQYRDSARVVSWDNDYYYPVESLKKPYELPCYPTEQHNTIAEIDKAIKGKYVLIISCHKVTENPGPYDISISEFKSIIDYIKFKNIRTQTISGYYEEAFKT